MAAEMGILGLLAFLWILVRFFYIFIVRPRSQQPQEAFILVGLAVSLLAFLAHSFVDTHLYSLQLSVLFWYMLGLAVSAYGQLKKELT